MQGLTQGLAGGGVELAGSGAGELLDSGAEEAAPLDSGAKETHATCLSTLHADLHAAPRPSPLTEDTERGLPANGLPLFPVYQLMVRGLPEGAMVSGDAKKCMCELAEELLRFVTMQAHRQRGPGVCCLQPENLIDAFTALGLHPLVPTIQAWQQRSPSSGRK